MVKETIQRGCHLRPLRLLDAPTLATVPAERTLMLDACLCSDPDVLA